MVKFFLSGDIFNAGIRPAINIGISVSRVGSSAQPKAMKQVAGKLKLELAQFAELEAFSQFASDLDQATQNQLARGTRLRELLKQPQSSPLSLTDQVATVYAGINGFLDTVEVNKVRSFLIGFRQYIGNSDFEKIVGSTSQFTQEAEDSLKELLSNYLKEFS